jgi:hypothetical protein
MGWLDNLFRRKQGTTSSTQDMADAQKAQQKDAEREAPDELEEQAHVHRDEEVFREGPIPPGTS